jgi:2'-5' RNA ligase
MLDDAAAAEIADSIRLFFALWPDATMQATLSDAVSESVGESEGRPVPASNFHLTLAFLGSVPRDRLPVLAEIATRCATNFRLAQPRIVFTLDTIEHWRRPHILCATSHEVPPGVATLARSLKRALTAEGFSLDVKTPFRVHVTVARKVNKPSEPRRLLAPVTWSFDELALIQSLTSPDGSVYTPLSTYPLG